MIILISSLKIYFLRLRNKLWYLKKCIFTFISDLLNLGFIQNITGHLLSYEEN